MLFFVLIVMPALLSAGVYYLVTERWSLLALEGRSVQIAFQQGSKIADFDMISVMMKRLTITGSTLRAQPPQNKARIADGLRTHLWPKFAAGTLRVVIHRIFAFDDVVAAHSMLESGQHVGKLLLKVR